MGRVLTLRGVDDETAARLKTEAERQGRSMNSLVLEFVHRGLGIGSPRRGRHHDLDEFFGSWSDQEAEVFLESISEFEVIDEALWRSPVDSG